MTRSTSPSQAPLLPLMPTTWSIPMSHPQCRPNLKAKTQNVEYALENQKKVVQLLSFPANAMAACMYTLSLSSSSLDTKKVGGWCGGFHLSNMLCTTLIEDTSMIYVSKIGCPARLYLDDVARVWNHSAFIHLHYKVSSSNREQHACTIHRRDSFDSYLVGHVDPVRSRRRPILRTVLVIALTTFIMETYRCTELQKIPGSELDDQDTSTLGKPDYIWLPVKCLLCNNDHHH